MGQQLVCSDRRGDDGNWLLEVARVRTVSGAMWKNIQVRTKIGGAEQCRRSYYKGCDNGFIDFQDFVDWHTTAAGYGLGYQLEKDLLIKGNKTYSRSTCTLLPLQVNTLMTKRHNHRGAWPIGVTCDKRTGMFSATCSNGSGYSVHLGQFVVAEDAFMAYKKYKEALFKKLAEQYKATIDPMAYEALMNYEVSIGD